MVTLRGERMFEFFDRLVSIVLPLVAGLLKRWLDDKLDDKQRAVASDVAKAAFLAVEKLAAKTPGTIDDKLAAGLGQLAEILEREPTPLERQVAKATWAKLAS